ncbi:MAG: hypothetical protein K6E85_13840 [Lachnospiraceae bacterium]|nr:hypothetical protein [Lachnospiraceae bacterium]
MNYEEFKEKFVEDVKDKLYEQGAEVNVALNDVNKLNENYDAMTVSLTPKSVRSVGIGASASTSKSAKPIKVCLACHFCGKLYDKNHFIKKPMD